MNHASRLERFGEALAEGEYAAAIITERRDLYYLTGTAQPCNLVVVPGEAPVVFARRAAELVRQEVAGLRVETAASFEPVVDFLREHAARGGRVGAELDVLPAVLARSLEKALAPSTVENVSPLVVGLRMVKDEDEIELLRQAAKLFDSAHQALLDHIRPGIAEHELSAEVARSLRRAGHNGVVFYRRWDAWLQPEGLVVSGSNLPRIAGHVMSVTGVGMSRALPWGASRRKLEVGDPVVIDCGLNLDGYHADMSRTYVVGPASDEQRRLFGACRRCFDEVVSAIRPGVSSDVLYRVAHAVMEDEGLAEWFQGYGAQQGQYIGHGVGLELDEPPTLWPRERTTLAEGMVLAIEPKVISPSFGAFDLEDTVVVNASGAEVLGSVGHDLFAVS